MIQAVGELSIEALPRGQRVRLWVELGADALGSPWRVPVIVARGRAPGPVVGMTAALHGDEVNGVRALHRLMSGLPVKALRGAVVAVLVANPSGFQRQERFFEGEVDLNHVMPGRAGGAAHEAYAHLLWERIVSRFDRLVDLHTASAGRVNSLYVRADLCEPVAAQMARQLGPQIILHSPPEPGTLRRAAVDAGIPAVTVEIGDPQVFQPGLIRRAAAGLRAVIAGAGALALATRAGGAAPVICARSSWIYTPQGGLLEVSAALGARVEAGEKIGQLIDLFGDLTQELRAPHAGVVIGKSTNPVGVQGARVLHLGVEGLPAGAWVGEDL